MEEDEDVVLEGTALDQHLQNTGFRDYETVTSQNISGQTNYKNFIKENVVQNMLQSTLGDLILRAFQVHKLKQRTLQTLVFKLLGSKLMEEDDLFSLQHISSAMKKVQDDDDDNHHLMTEETSFSVINLFPFSLACVVALAVIYQCYWGSLSLLHTFFIAFLASVFVIRYLVLRLFNSVIDRVQSLLQVMNAVKKTSLKALKVLKEIEIIGHANQNENWKQSAYEESVYNGLFSLFEHCRRFLKNCHRAHLLTSSFEGIGTSVESLFGRRFDECSDVFEALDLSSVKAERRLIFYQLSGFLSELLLDMEYADGFMNKFNASAIIPLSPQKLNGVRKELVLLNKILKMSETFWLNAPPKNERSFEVVKNDVLVSSAALSFHSKSFVSKVMSFSEKLESDNGFCGAENQSMSFDESMKFYEEVKCELQSCNGCLEDLSERIKKHFWLGEKVHNVETSGDINQKESPAASNEAVPLFGVEPPVILDEVFEAVADEYKTYEIIEDLDWLTDRKQEREFQRMQKQRCKRVLQEIQPILQKRRTMWTEREEIALKRRDSTIASSATMTTSTVCSKVNNKITTDISSLPEISTVDNLEGLEYDSDEERLELYKKVRKELDEDETSRNQEEGLCSHSVLRKRNIRNTDALRDESSSETDRKRSSDLEDKDQEFKSSFESTGIDASPPFPPNEYERKFPDGETFSFGDESNKGDDSPVDWSCYSFPSSPQCLEERTAHWGSAQAFNLRSLLQEPNLPSADHRLTEETFGGCGELSDSGDDDDG